MAATVDVRVIAEDDTATPDQLDARLRLLASGLQEVRGVSVQPLDAEATEGAKGVGALLGLLASVVTDRTAVTAFVSSVSNWLSQRGARKVRLEIDGRVIEIERATADEQARLVDAFLEQARAAGGS